MSPLLARALAGAALGLGVTFIARRRHALSRSGAAAALIVAVICTAAGWSWALILMAFFVSANLLSRYRTQTRDARMGGMIEKGGERDAWQVVANGGVFTVAAIAYVFNPSELWLPVAAGAIAAATADTWATEIGTVGARLPRLITTRRPVAAGTSGGVSWLGSFAGLAGATFIGVVALIVGWSVAAAGAAVAGGVAGMLVDSLAGASIQRRGWCPTCGKPTERLVHSCGSITEARGGIQWVNNDAVNAIGSIAGAAIGSLFRYWPTSL